MTYAKGWGSIADPNTVSVAASDGSTLSISTKNILLATGSEVTPLPGIPIDEQRSLLIFLLPDPRVGLSLPLEHWN